FEVSSSIVAANVAAGHGGGLRLGGSANGRVVQSTITGNLAQTGAGLFWFGSPWFTCDVVGAIIWGNDSFEGGEIQVEGFEAAPPRNLSSSIRGWPEARDPMFMDPAGPDRDPLTWADNDYTPSPASTVIDWGWPVPEP